MLSYPTPNRGENTIFIFSNMSWWNWSMSNINGQMDIINNDINHGAINKWRHQYFVIWNWPAPGRWWQSSVNWKFASPSPLAYFKFCRSLRSHHFFLLSYWFILLCKEKTSYFFRPSKIWRVQHDQPQLNYWWQSSSKIFSAPARWWRHLFMAPNLYINTFLLFITTLVNNIKYIAHDAYCVSVYLFCINKEQNHDL